MIKYGNMHLIKWFLLDSFGILLKTMKPEPIKYKGQDLSPDDFRRMLIQQLVDQQQGELGGKLGTLTPQDLQGVARKLERAEKTGRPWGLMDFLRRKERTENIKTMREKVMAGEMLVLRGTSRGAQRVVIGQSKVLDPELIVLKTRFREQPDLQAIGKEMQDQKVGEMVRTAQGQIHKVSTNMRENMFDIIMKATMEGSSLEMGMILPSMLEIMDGRTIDVTKHAVEALDRNKPTYPPMFKVTPGKEEGRAIVQVMGAEQGCEYFEINAAWAVKRAAETMSLVLKSKAEDGTETPEGRTKARSDYQNLHNASIELLMRQLPEEAGSGMKALLESLGAHTVIAARILPLTISATLMDKKVGGMMLELGGKGDHAYAFSAGTPTLLGMRGLITDGHVGTDHTVILDDELGIGIINPDKTTLEYYNRKKAYIDTLNMRRQEHMKSPFALTRDGVKVELLANAEFTTQLDDVNRFNIPAIGLLRAEGKLLEVLADHNNKSAAELRPVVAKEMFRFFRGFIDEFNGETVMIRDMDVAGRDKVTHEVTRLYGDLNSFMGGVDFALHAEDLHKGVLQAIVEASEYAAKKGKSVNVLVPMVTTTDQLRRYNARLDEVAHETGFKKPDVYVMIETPESVRIRDALIDGSSGASIGTNDLIHFTTGLPRRDKDFPPVHPGVIGYIEDVCKSGNEKGKPSSICGEMAYDPVGALIAVLAGARKLSGSAIMAPEIKEILSELDTKEHAHLLTKSKACKDPDELRALWRREFPALAKVESFTEKPPFEIPEPAPAN
jgi:phosphoenolpyruvate-protein phosphotransferase (PTS system enzyme I)